MIFTSVEAYLDALRGDPALAIIPLGMVAELKGLSRSAISEQIKSGRLDSLIVEGRRKTWRGITPKALFEQAERLECGSRDRSHRVAGALAEAGAAGRLIAYGEVMAAAGMSASNPRDRAAIGIVLAELSRQSLRAEGCLVGAIVIQKASGHPNVQFFELARELGVLGEGDRMEFWRGQCAKVFAGSAFPRAHQPPYGEDDHGDHRDDDGAERVDLRTDAQPHR
jgi:hypothetical protein